MAPVLDLCHWSDCSDQYGGSTVPDLIQNGGCQVKCYCAWLNLKEYQKQGFCTKASLRRMEHFKSSILRLEYEGEEDEERPYEWVGYGRSNMTHKCRMSRSHVSTDFHTRRQQLQQSRRIKGLDEAFHPSSGVLIGTTFTSRKRWENSDPPDAPDKVRRAMCCFSKR